MEEGKGRAGMAGKMPRALLTFVAAEGREITLERQARLVHWKWQAVKAGRRKYNCQCQCHFHLSHGLSVPVFVLCLMRSIFARLEGRTSVLCKSTSRVPELSRMGGTDVDKGPARGLNLASQPAIPAMRNARFRSLPEKIRTPT